MLLDFSTLETCTETLDAVTTIPLEDILMIDKSYGNNTYSNEWIEEYINFDIFENKSMIDTTFFHLTTTGKIDEITKNGLQNLQTVLSTDNFSTDFFKQYDIQFDIEKERIVNNNRIIDLDNIEFSNPFYRIKNRVYFDYNINGFYYFNTEHQNYSVIDEIPEFVDDTLCRIFTKPSTYEKVREDWVQQTDRYVVKAKIPLANIEIECSEEFPYYVTSKLLDVFLEDSKELVPTDRDIIYLLRDQTVSADEIELIIKL